MKSFLPVSPASGALVPDASARISSTQCHLNEWRGTAGGSQMGLWRPGSESKVCEFVGNCRLGAALSQKLPPELPPTLPWQVGESLQLIRQRP